MFLGEPVECIVGVANGDVAGILFCFEVTGLVIGADRGAGVGADGLGHVVERVDGVDGGLVGGINDAGGLVEGVGGDLTQCFGLFAVGLCRCIPRCKPALERVL